MGTYRQPTLISLGGLPATGKSAIARPLANALSAAYVRIDSIEAAIARSEGSHQETNRWKSAPGYEVGFAIAADQLALGMNVIAESVNAMSMTRDGWLAVSRTAGVLLLEVELVCSDRAEHRRRAQQRVLDIEGIHAPTWQEIVNREYEPWQRDRLVIDTALRSVTESVSAILAAGGLG